MMHIVHLGFLQSTFNASVGNETVEASLPVLIHVLYRCLSNSLAACHLIFG